MPWQCPFLRLSVRLSARPSEFSGIFFNMLCNINLKLSIYIQYVARHVEFEFHHNRVALTYSTAENRSNPFFCNNGLINQDTSLKFGTYVAPCTHLDISPFSKNFQFSELWRLFLRVLDFWKFSGYFSTCFDILIWNLVNTSSRWHHISSLRFIASRHFHLLYSQK